LPGRSRNPPVERIPSSDFFARPRRRPAFISKFGAFNPRRIPARRLPGTNPAELEILEEIESCLEELSH